MVLTAKCNEPQKTIISTKKAEGYRTIVRKYQKANRNIKIVVNRVKENVNVIKIEDA